jgi:sensor histidine kinase YesM
MMSIVLLSIIAFLYYKYNTSKIKNEKLELERKLLQSQMNPHFLFNALSAIQRYMFQNNPKEAGKYLSKFASFMRSILEYSRQEQISLSEELKVLENYLQLQSMRFEHSFTYSFQIHSSIDKDKTMIPPMLLQPFIENSIEHGFKGKEEIGEISINIDVVENWLQFEVIDNGVGLEQSKSLHNEDHESLGTTITKERVIKLNKKKKAYHSILIENYKRLNETISGTRVKFYIPHITYN